MSQTESDPRRREGEDSLQEQARRETAQRERSAPLSDENGRPTQSTSEMASDQAERLRRPTEAGREALTPQPDENPDQRRRLEEEAAKAPAPTPPIANPD